jgi:hypothetical protein
MILNSIQNFTEEFKRFLLAGKERSLWRPCANPVAIEMYAQMACELWIFLVVTSVNVTYG